MTRLRSTPDSPSSSNGSGGIDGRQPPDTLVLPEGSAHGYRASQEDNTEIFYQASEFTPRLWAGGQVG